MKIGLNGTWKLSSKKLENLDIKIPGTVLDSLLENKIIEDPYYRDNEDKTRAWLYDDYSLYKEFSLAKEQLKGHNFLCFYSVICVADIYINEHLIVKMNDMHIEKIIELDNKILKEKNIIRIEITSPYTYIRTNPNKDGFLSVAVTEPNSPNLRQSNHMFGWDWGINIADMGIMGDIYILHTDLGYLESHRETYKWNKDSVDVAFATNFKKLSNGNITLSLSFDGEELYKDTQQLNESNRFDTNVKNPHLWWPNGYGNQPLYDVKILVENESEKIEENYRIGLKRVRIDDSFDEFGRNFTFYINDVKIFIGGANYIPEDALLSRITKDRTRRLLELCKDANFTCVRVWGGGFYPYDYFYEICDELGLLVMQDLMFACSGYDIFEEGFKKNVVEETELNLRRIRHHTSLLLISGNNEIEDGVRGHGFKHAQRYVEMFHHVLADIVKKETDLYYLPSSPTSGDPIFASPNDPNYLDCHYWSVWGDNQPMDWYLAIEPRFLSEFGMQSFPNYDTVMTYALESDLVLDSKVLLTHQKREGCNERMMSYLREYYKEPKDFKELVYLTKLTQAKGMKVMVEHIRQNLHKCNGALFWQLNDDWPCQTWSAVDYNFGLKALYYYSKRFFNQHLISFCKKEDGVIINVSNTSKDNKTYKINYRYESFTGKKSLEGSNRLTINAYSDVDAVNGLKEPKENEVLYAELQDDKDNVISSSIYQGQKDKYINYPAANILLERIDDQSFKVKSNVFANEIYLEVHNNEIVLDDNYFFLLSGQEKIIHTNKKIDIKDIEVKYLR